MRRGVRGPLRRRPSAAATTSSATQGVSGQHDFSHMDVGDIFSMFDDIFGGAFGGGGGGAAGSAGGAAQRGFDLETQVELTLAEVASGAEKTIEFEKQDTCETCKGSGAKPGVPPVVCVQCGGQGRVAQQGFGGMFRMVTTCPNCRGRGTVVRDHCPTCGGSGRQMRKRVVTVKIPAGVHEGQAVRIAGEGEAGENGAPPGDLHCYIAVKPHPIFTPAQQRSGLPGPDLLHAGGPGRQDRSADAQGPAKSWRSPPAPSTAKSSSSRARACPIFARTSSGDELVQILIEVPKKLTEQQKQLLREFAARRTSS